MTDQEIMALLNTPKHTKTSKIKWITKGKHKQCDIDVSSDDLRHSFKLYLRQNTINPDSFSCGIRLDRQGLEPVTLMRCNGPDHAHGNPIEGDTFSGKCHIHTATERYISAGRKPEHYACPTTEYTDMMGALSCLLTQCNVKGLQFTML